MVKNQILKLVFRRNIQIYGNCFRNFMTTSSKCRLNHRDINFCVRKSLLKIAGKTETDLIFFFKYPIRFILFRWTCGFPLFTRYVKNFHQTMKKNERFQFFEFFETS